MKALQKLLAASLALSLPMAGLAQAAPPAAEDTVKVTPYGFILANAYMTGNSLAANDYPGQATTAARGGAVLYSARQSRLGFRLATKDSWSGADINGVVEFDFNAGHLSTASTAWYNGIMRLRLANMTASWKTGAGSVSVLAGQDYGLVNTLFAESLAWVASPLFWQAGNVWRRAPQFRLSWSDSFGDYGLNAAVAALSPATADGASVDFGTGNQSRTPNIEARLGATAKFAPDVTAALGLGYHAGKRRLAYGTANQQDLSDSLFGVDLDLGLTKYAQVKGEYYNGKGADDTYSSIGAAFTGAAPNAEAIKTSGMWAQAILKPMPWLWVTAGYGQAKADEAQSAAGARTDNKQAAGGVLVNAGKFWRFGVEYCQVTTTYKGNATDQKATQLAVSSMLKF